ncbi:MAG: DNA mismatch repair protein MutS [Deltaproteobacteria bacterium]|nr:DNA mismatch repair protein MutS [Deltaproteobacteria bacterium]
MAEQAAAAGTEEGGGEIGQLTPMLRQYLEVKSQTPGALLFFRLGDFYELFFEDAVKAAELLQITLTSRAKGDTRIPMCGVPYHSARRYVARLIDAGLKVAICEQVEPPGTGPGIVRREVTRIISPGMVLDEEVLEAKENNFLAAILPGKDGYGLALLDASTGDFLAAELAGAAALAEELGRAGARELLVPSGEESAPWLVSLCAQLARTPAVAGLEGAAFSPARSHALLKEHLRAASLEGFGLSGTELSVGAAGAALRYLKDTQRTEARHVDRLRRLQPAEQLRLDEASLANLEILRTLKDGGRRGALLGVLDRTATGMGARTLARWLAAPLAVVPEINARLDAVEELSNRSLWREELLGLLKGVADLERLSGRLALGAGNARDLLALSRSLEQLPQLGAALGRCQAPLLRLLAGPLGALGNLQRALSGAVVEEPPTVLKEGGMFRVGFHPELDRLIALTTSGKNTLLAMEQRERERTGIPSLKVRFNKIFGYYIEVTRANLDRVPADYQRRQTTVNAERFVTEELKRHETEVLTAEERRFALEFELFESLRAQVIAHVGPLRAAAEAVATADVLLSFARCAAEYGYCRPVVEDSDRLELQASRHPVVERLLTGDVFVPNDVTLSRDAGQLLILTGPNMAGKSTVMRQVALCTLMAQAGSFVPAARAHVGLCDRIFTRVGAADNLARGQSTFMVEMTETANILHHASRRSLVVLDEIGRGTSTFDGLSIAWAVAEHLHDRVGARTLFATHYHELTDLSRERPRVRNLSMAVKEVQGKVLFLRKLVEGGANQSYGIEVARLAGLPPEVVARARDILANLESGEPDDAGRPRLSQKGRARAPPPAAQMGLFLHDAPPLLRPEERAVLESLRALAVDATNPLEALNLLAQWKKAL